MSSYKDNCIIYISLHTVNFLRTGEIVVRKRATVGMYRFKIYDWTRHCTNVITQWQKKKQKFCGKLKQRKMTYFSICNIMSYFIHLFIFFLNLEFMLKVKALLKRNRISEML